MKLMSSSTLSEASEEARDSAAALAGGVWMPPRTPRFAHRMKLD
jgi:hypothetical protein